MQNHSVESKRPPRSTHPFSRIQRSRTQQRCTTLLLVRWTFSPLSFRDRSLGSFSKRYGWTQDRYGLSWQVMFTGDRKIEQKITPTLMFVGEQCGKAEEAINLYASVFHNAKVDHILRYGQEEKPNKEGTIKHAGVSLQGESFAVMDSARAHNFAFNEAISFMVQCNTQEEIDYFWSKLSADPKAEACGWLKDKFGLSWQIVPAVMDEMLRDKNEKRLARVTEAFLNMKKFDIAKLKEAYSQDRAAA
jgi:predicted 3-demethylubiquinone-9 3-methyltransferase (glyoxalase superfamily)